MGIISKNLGIRIKKLRERNNLTQLKLAEIINMESSNLSRYFDYFGQPALRGRFQVGKLR